jgi:ABC-type dipeptide/oligopeptide/nickel transport system permease subunit
MTTPLFALLLGVTFGLLAGYLIGAGVEHLRNQRRDS